MKIHTLKNFVITVQGNQMKATMTFHPLLMSIVFIKKTTGRNVGEKRNFHLLLLELQIDADSVQ